jgi:hypothetical protein
MVGTIDPSPRYSGYSGTTIHHYVTGVDERGQGEEESTRRVESSCRGEDHNDETLRGRLSREILQERGDLQAHQAHQARQARQVRDVEDVIRRHAIRRYHREGVDGQEEQGMSFAMGGMRESVMSIPPLYKTPTKKKGEPANLRKSKEGNSVGRKKGGARRKGKISANGRKNTFAFLGNLFSSQDVRSAKNAEEKWTIERQRPPKLLVHEEREPLEQQGNRMADSQEEGDGDKLASPLMVMSPGLSCGGLLDEKFASAMRGAEGVAGDEGAASVSERVGDSIDGDEDDLLQALSPRSLLASPRVLRKLSNVAEKHTVPPRKEMRAKVIHRSTADSEISCYNENNDPMLPREDNDGNYKKNTSSKAEANTKAEAVKQHEAGNYDEDQVYILMQQVKAQQAKILELEGKCSNMKLPSPDMVAHNAVMEDQLDDKMPLGDGNGPATTEERPRVSQQKERIQPHVPEQQDAMLRLQEEHASVVLQMEKERERKIQQAESNHATKVEALEASFENKLKLSKQDWETERADLLKKCSDLEGARREADLKLKRMTEDKEALDELVHSTKQKVSHLEEASVNAERRVDEAVRQKALIEDTSMALANQIAVLTQRVQSAEKTAENAQQELQIQQAAMKTRVSTVESLNQEIQRLTVENTRLVGDKSSMEEHVRRLTSILHTVMAPNMSGAALVGLPLGTTAPSELSGDTRDEKTKLPIPPADDLMTRTDKDTEAPSNRELDATRRPFAPHNVTQKAGTKTEYFQKDMGEMNPEEAKEYRERRTTELDKELLDLNMEKEQLDQELAKMPFNTAGKTAAQRRRKKMVENRLDELFKEIGKVKRELRSIKIR